jgi:DNA repair exonuclease SbcCD ATPase subunit
MTDFPDASMGTLNTRLQVLHEDVTDIKSVLKDLTSAITKLALIEERQTQASAAQERAFKALERIEDRVNALEKRVPMNDHTNKWVERVITAVILALVISGLKQMGIS